MNFEALFLGPKSENRAWFKSIISELLDEHIHWRRNFHPEDKCSITSQDKNEASFLETRQKSEDLLYELSSALRTSQIPSHSPRYAAHMITDLLMPAIVAYITTMLYNPNNVAWEASPVTTSYEIQAGDYIAQMLGFSEKAYGHITSGGTLANIEALWIARNLKTIPFALKEIAPQLIGDHSSEELNNFPLSKTLDLVDKIGHENVEKIEELKFASIRGRGVNGGEWKLGKVFAPRTKHYSWNKALDVLGVGQNNLVYIDVDLNFRLNIKDLTEKVEKAIHDKEPILMVVGVLGSTEEGAVDPLDDIVKLREHCYSKHKVWFWIHADAAYGGYSASIFRDENFKLIPRNELIERLDREKIINKKYNWPSQDVYDSYSAIPSFDSVTIDPHKLGYVPYQAGSLVVADRRVRDLISYFATYVFQVNENQSTIPLGSYILEGSKAGAAAAAVWMAHRCVPGNIGGYGKIIGESFEGAHILYQKLQHAKNMLIEFKTTKKYFSIHPLNYPDTNLLVYVVNEDGNTSLTKLNAITNSIIAITSPKLNRSAPTFNLLLSSTTLTYAEYGDCPKPLLKNIGINDADWDQIHSVPVLRSTLMSPYTTPDYSTANYEEVVVVGIKEVLQYLLARGER